MEVIAPDFVGDWRRGSEVELCFVARGLDDLAGYGFDLTFDPMEMEILGQTGDVAVASLFAQNPTGFFTRVEKATGRLQVAAARHGKQWSAVGDGELARMRIRLYQDGFPESLRIEEGIFLSADYELTDVRLLHDPTAIALPTEFSLDPNYPNPFNPTTTISFRVPISTSVSRGGTPVSIEVFNTLGQSVRTLVDGALSPGYHRAEWDGRNGSGHSVGSGVYVYRVSVGTQARIGKMTLLK